MVWNSYADAPVHHDTALSAERESVSGLAMAYRREAIGPMAAGIALFTLMTLPAALLAIAAIYGLTTSPEQVRSHLEGVARYAPEQIAGLAKTVIAHIVAVSTHSLRFAALGAVAVALLSAQRSAAATMAAINRIARLQEKRSFFRRQGTALLLGIAGIAVLAIALFGLVALPAIGRTIGWESNLWRFYTVARWPAAFVLVASYLALIYRYAPAHWSMSWGAALGGAAAGAALSVLVTFGVALWTERVRDYAALYGVAGSLLIIMLWAYLSALAAMIGAVIASAARDRRQRRLLVEAAWND